MKIGEKISLVARERGLDIKQVAKAAGIPYGSLRNYTKPNAKTAPSAKNALVLARTLGVPTDWLIDDEQGLPAPPRLEMPPFSIRPWPPDVFTWEDVQTGLIMHAWFRYLDLLHEIGESKAKGELPPDKAVLEADQVLHAIGRIWIDGGKGTEAARKALTGEAGAWLDKVVPRMVFRDEEKEPKRGRRRGTP